MWYSELYAVVEQRHAEIEADEQADEQMAADADAGS